MSFKFHSIDLPLWSINKSTDKASIGGTPSGHEMRSSRTRAQLIAAAIEVFSRIGFEAASIRLLAKEGKANLSAIPYHFGGKREFYMAAAQEIADYTQGRIEEINVILEDPETKSPREPLEKALSCFLRILPDDTEPRSWTTFFARCVPADLRPSHRAVAAQPTPR